MQATAHETRRAPEQRQKVSTTIKAGPPAPLRVETAAVLAAVIGCDAANADSRRPSAAAPAVATISRPIDPMLLVHQERVKTFLVLAGLVRRALRAVAARFTAN